VNKKTGEFSAADLKKPIGRKEPGRSPNGEGSLQDTSPVKGRFVCGTCGHEHSESELADNNGPGINKKCKACCARLASIADGSFRDSTGRTHEAHKRNKQRAAFSRYQSGRLPKWMFS
jgi:hypothetical protein